jgi:hypothetical protein
MTVQAPKVQRTAEPLYEENLPDKPCIALDEVISLLGRHGVDIPEEEAKQIEDFIEKQLNNSPMSRFQRGLPPTATMEHLYRSWFAGSWLHWELMEHPDRSPVWRNWSVTGQPVRLDAEGRKRAMTMLERMISYNQDRFNDFLSGREQLTQRSTTADSSVFNADDRKWLNCLGFETKEVLGFLRANQSTNELGAESLGAYPKAPEHPASIEDTVNASAAVPRPPRAKQRRNELDDVIDKAIAIAAGSHRTSTVWQALRELALVSEPPLTGAKGDDGSLVYAKDQYSNGKKKTGNFTRNALDTRLNRRWDALGRIGPRQ